MQNLFLCMRNTPNATSKTSPQGLSDSSDFADYLRGSPNVHPPGTSAAPRIPESHFGHNGHNGVFCNGVYTTWLRHKSCSSGQGE